MDTTIEEIKQILKENTLAMAELRKAQAETTAQIKATDDEPLDKQFGYLDSIFKQLNEIGVTDPPNEKLSYDPSVPHQYIKSNKKLWNPSKK